MWQKCSSSWPIEFNFNFSMVNFSEIGCGTNTDCPNQKACINALCIDPCAQSNVCTQHQECQVDNHQVVCIEGKLSRSNVFWRSIFNVMHKFVNFHLQLAIQLVVVIVQEVHAIQSPVPASKVILQCKLSAYYW